MLKECIKLTDFAAILNFLSWLKQLNDEFLFRRKFQLIIYMFTVIKQEFYGINWSI